MPRVDPNTAPAAAASPPAEELLVQLYGELRRLAAAKLAREKPGQTLQATALVHEAWLRLEREGGHPWDGPTHFFRAAAEAMRRILVDQARRKRRARHGGGLVRRATDVGDLELAAPLPDEQLLVVDEALDGLEAEDPRAAAVVKLHFFAGQTLPEVAVHLGVSRATVGRTWAFARAWLFRAMQTVAEESEQPVSVSRAKKRRS